MTKYIITGATGGLGSQVFKYLLKLVRASDIVVSLYNPSGATEAIKASGVEIRRGDYSDPASLDSAFAGGDKLLLVSYPTIVREPCVRNHKNAIDSARRAGIQHIYYTSLAYAPDSVAGIMQAHIDTETYLKESGLTYTIIREGVYSESWPLYFGFFNPAEGNDEVVVPYSDGPIAWNGFENETLLFTGSRTLSLKELADKVSSLLGRNVKLAFSSEEAYIKANVGKPGPQGNEELLRCWATSFKALERGELGVVDLFLQQLLGRELTPFEGTLKEMLLWNC